MSIRTKKLQEEFVIVEDEDIPIKQWNEFIRWETSDEIDEGGIYFLLKNKDIGLYFLVTTEGDPFDVMAVFEVTNYGEPKESGNFYISEDLLFGIMEMMEEEEEQIPSLIKDTARRMSTI